MRKTIEVPSPIDLSGVIVGFTELNPEIQDLLQGIVLNTIEVATHLKLSKQGGPNVSLYESGLAEVLTEKLTRRIMLAAKLGVNEEHVVSSIDEGFTLSGIK